LRALRRRSSIVRELDTKESAMPDHGRPAADTASLIVLDLDSGIPPWRQVRDQLIALVEHGRLPVGARLPAIRQLATDLGVAAGTVARAYKELEAEGLLRTARRHGTVVAAAPSGRADPLRVAAEAFVDTVLPLGVDARTATAAVQRAFDLSESGGRPRPAPGSGPGKPPR
jgi:GntR family transcriptional regulator